MQLSLGLVGSRQVSLDSSTRVSSLSSLLAWAYFINNAHRSHTSLSCCGRHRLCQTQSEPSQFFEPRCSLATTPVTMAIAATNPFLAANCSDNGQSGVRVRGEDWRRRWRSTWRVFWRFPYRRTFWPMCITHGSRSWCWLTRWRRQTSVDGAVSIREKWVMQGSLHKCERHKETV